MATFPICGAWEPGEGCVTGFPLKQGTSERLPRRKVAIESRATDACRRGDLGHPDPLVTRQRRRRLKDSLATGQGIRAQEHRSVG